jgi:hypothetical protein
MACHNLYLKDSKEFYGLLKQRDPDIIFKMVKCVFNAAKRGKEQVDIFEVIFKDMSELTFTIDQPQYKELLNNCLDDLIAVEDYEMCGEIKKFLEKPEKKEEKVI